MARTLTFTVFTCLSALLACTPDQKDPARPAAPVRADAGASHGEDAGHDDDVDAKTVACGDQRCAEPARCYAGPPSRCYCPLGFRDVKNDGSQCEDWNECEILPNICDRGGKCTNTPGSYECECASPSHRLEGKLCVCADGYTRSSDGLCLAQDGRECADDLDCLNNHCEGGTCCAQSCDHPSECHTSANATCSDGKTCEYPMADDGTACDDAQACTRDTTCQGGTCSAGRRETCDDGNPCTDDDCQEPIGCKNKNNHAPCDDGNACTEADHCDAGACNGALKACDAQSDSCNTGVCDPKSGACKKEALRDGTLCDDASSCSLDDSCAAGSCVGHRNACGPNALTCSAADPTNTCMCQDGFLAAQGVCVPLNNECASANACSADADCFDPSNTPGDLQCTCKPGYAGNGATCTPVEPCSNNPCGEGRGTCSAAAAGRYSCACDPGYVAVGGSCVCDLSGTFAARARLDLQWEGTSDAIEGGSDTVYSYALERHTYDASGNLQLELVACGDTPLDFCGIGIAPVLAAESYSQFMPVHIWDLPSMPRVSTRLSLPSALPGGTFETDTIAMLRGVKLTNPTGPWPSSYRSIAGSPDFDGAMVNGATWLDQDADDVIGITAYVVPPGGIQADGTPPDPPRSYGQLSPTCPRSGGPHTPYAYWPAPTLGTNMPPLRVKRIYTASRVISAYKGKINSCDQYSGNIIGPDNGKIQLEARVGGCVRTSGSSETACTSPAIDFIDQAAQNQTVVSATFLVKRLPSDVPATCASVRSFNFD